MNNTVSCGALMEALTFMLENRANDMSIMNLRQAQNSVNTDKRPADKLMDMSVELGMNKNVKNTDKELSQSFNDGMMSGTGEPQGPLPTEDDILPDAQIDDEQLDDTQLDDESTDEFDISEEEADENLSDIGNFIQSCMDQEQTSN